MSGHEITVAVTEQLPVIFVILNDQGLGMVKFGQRLAEDEPIGFELPPIDFALIAKAVGANNYVIRNVEELTQIDYLALCTLPGPTLLDVRVDPEELPPMGGRVQALRV